MQEGTSQWSSPAAGARDYPRVSAPSHSVLRARRRGAASAIRRDGRRISRRTIVYGDGRFSFGYVGHQVPTPRFMTFEFLFSGLTIVVIVLDGYRPLAKSRSR